MISSVKSIGLVGSKTEVVIDLASCSTLKVVLSNDEIIYIELGERDGKPGITVSRRSGPLAVLPQAVNAVRIVAE